MSAIAPAPLRYRFPDKAPILNDAAEDRRAITLCVRQAHRKRDKAIGTGRLESEGAPNPPHSRVNSELTIIVVVSVQRLDLSKFDPH